MGGPLKYSVPAPDDLTPGYAVPAPDDDPSTFGISRAGFILGRNEQQPAQQKEAHGFWQAAQAGQEGSATGMIASGRLPRVVLDPHHATWYERLAYMVAQTASDLPLMALSGAAAAAVAIETGPGAVVAGGAAAFGVPTAIRTALTEAYSKGSVTSVGDFLNRTNIVLENTNRDLIVGGLTAGTGVWARGAVTPLAEKLVAQGVGEKVATRLAQLPALGAEATTMTVAPALLQGRLPEPQEFLDAAVLIGGMHGAHVVAGKLLTLYRKTGVRPVEALADAQTDPSIAEDLTRPILESGATDKSSPNQTGERAGSEGAPADAAGPRSVRGREGSDPSLTAILRGFSGAEQAGISHPEGAVLGTVEGLTPTHETQAVGGVSGRGLIIRAFGGDTKEAVVKIDRSVEDGGKISHVFTILGPDGNYAGSGLVDERPDNYRLWNIGIDDPQVKGTGRGLAAYRYWIDRALSEGKEFRSDMEVSRDAQHIYEALERRGYVVEKNPNAIKEENGKLFTKRGTVYRVTGKKTGVSYPKVHLSVATDEAGPSGRPAHVVGSIRGNTFLIGTMHGEGIKGVGYDLYPALGRYLKENHPEVKWVVGLAGGTVENPEGIARLRNSFDGTQWNGKWAGTPVESLASGPVSLDSNNPVPRAYREVAARVNAQDAVPGVKAQQVADQPFGTVTQLPGEPAHPTEVNYNYINTSEDVKGALARISQIYEEEIQTQRRGKVSWDETQNEAGQWLKDNLGLDANVETRAPGTPAGAAELLARKQMTQGAAEEVARQAKALQEAGADATQEQRAQFLAAVDRAALITSEFLGARAEAGRTLNILKETKVAAERAEQIQAILSRFDKSPEDIAAMMADMDSAANVLRLARKLSTATTWDKVVEAWKAGLCSGPITQTANLMGNTSFMALRPAVDAVASLFDMRSGADRVRFSEPLARVVGDLQGVADGLRAAKSALIDEAPGGKAEHKQSISGKAGYWVRSPFRLLSAGDALFRIMVERGEAYALSAREAAKEGFNPATREFRNRVVELAHNPTEAMLDKIDAAGKRFTFNTPLGEKGKAVQKFVKSWHLEMVVPFIATPGNVFKEMTRLTPAAPIVGEWRADFKAGGERGAKAMAEVALGTGISALTMTFALSGHISGSGDPDPDRRRVQMASGWQPYSIKIGGTWYSYQRFQPVGTLLGLAADMAEVKEHMTPDEMERVPSIVAAAFAHAVTEQTFLQGMSSVVDVLSDPERSAPKFIQNLSGSAVPALFGQMAQMLDPYQREVQSIREAIQNRIPGLREKLEPQRDMFGEPVQSQQRVAGLTPIGVKTESTDKVRTEAARLGVGVSSAPRSINLPAGGTKAGRVELTPGQRDIFADVAGHTAYQALAPIVNSPAWDYMNDFTKAKVYQDVFAATNKAGKAAALTSEERQAQIHHILQTLADTMKPVN